MPKNMPVSGGADPIPDIGSLRELLKHVHFNSFILVDLDNTLMESSQELGSDQWFSYFLAAVCQLLPHEPQALYWVLAIYDAVQQLTTVQPTEVGVARLIKMLQDIGIPIVAITARGESIIEPTLKQLESIHISFAKPWSQTLVPLNNAKRRIVFSGGIVFCNGQDKGLSLQLLFDWLGKIPEEIVMIDDKRKHLEAVANVLKTVSHFQGLRYAFLDHKVACFDAQLADLQLLAMWPKFPNSIRTIFNKIPWSQSLHSFFNISNQLKSTSPIDIDSSLSIVAVKPHP